MATFRRAYIPGATYFFTVVTHDRRPLLAEQQNIDALGQAFRRVKKDKPFMMEAVVLLPDHLHCLWTLPQGDADYSSRWRDIKKFASRSFALPNKTASAWQRGFWEHAIRNEADWRHHMDYIHYNPVKHGWAKAPRDWPWSSFHSHVKNGWYQDNWGVNDTPPLVDIDGE
ncbi:REP-associated tyrosine transposase [Halomonas alkaliantarctica]|uniref:REP-associated tyrosine transposase n=1 Tax=Halomonas alkaliantarctica TaxID=232346 RepID=UPI0004AA85A5|nr:transposase [Halomonas alkaliantarctica]